LNDKSQSIPVFLWVHFMIGILAWTMGTTLMNTWLLRRLLANDKITFLIGSLDAKKKIKTLQSVQNYIVITSII